jgi:hypothetical protein
MTPLASTDPRPRLQRYAFRDIDQSPLGPGIYAWYAIAPVGRRDWEPCIRGDRDLGAHNFLRLLANHTRRFAQITLKVSAESSFDTEWKGVLEDTGIESLAQMLQGSQTTAEDESTLRALVNTPALREVFATALNATSPILASPVYIGRATCLKTRLKDHSDRISLLTRRCNEDPSYRDRLPEKDIFADRAVKTGFTDSTLDVHTYDLTPYRDAGFTDEQLTAVAVSMELLLNRWYRPLLGRK